MIHTYNVLVAILVDSFLSHTILYVEPVEALCRGPGRAPPRRAGTQSRRWQRNLYLLPLRF